MKIEDIERLSGEFAEIQPGLALLHELDGIGQKTNERGFHRRMLMLAGYDLGKGVSLDPVQRQAYVGALNRLIIVWNKFLDVPTLSEFEAALKISVAAGELISDAELTAALDEIEADVWSEEQTKVRKANIEARFAACNHVKKYLRHQKVRQEV